MHLLRPRPAQQFHHARLRRPPHDRVVHHHHPLPGEHVAHRVVLDAGAEVAVGLARPDEGAAHVVVAQQAEFVRDAALLAVSERGRVGAVGHRDHAVSGNGVLPRELAPEGPPRTVDADAPEVRVGAREVHELEDAGRGGLGVETRETLDAAVPEAEQFTRLDVAHEGGPHDVERAGLAGDDMAAVQLAEHEGAEAARVAHRVHGVAHGEHERVGALQEAERVADLGHDRAVAGARDQVDDRFGIRRALEDRALVDELALDRVGVRQVAVVHDREVALRVAHHDRLRVDPLAAARGGIAHVAERGAARQRRDPVRGEDIRDEADLLVQAGSRSVRRADPGRLLAPVLQRVEREEGEFGGVLDSVDPHDSALFARTVVQKGKTDVGWSAVSHYPRQRGALRHSVLTRIAGS